MKKMKIGDKVRVVKDVWDDHNDCNWRFYIGYIKEPSNDPSGKKGWYVEFPAARKEIKSFDFYEDELELFND